MCYDSGGYVYITVVSENSYGFLFTNKWTTKQDATGDAAFGNIRFTDAIYTYFPLCIDNNDRIYVAYVSVTNPTRMSISTSSDNGQTWTFFNSTSGNGASSVSLSIDKDGVVHALFDGFDTNISSSYTQILEIRYAGVSWSTAISLTNNTTSNARYPMLGYQKYNQENAVRYIFDNTQSSSIEYGSIPLDSPPNAPILTAHTNFDATGTQSLAWTFSDPDPGDSQSAYQLQIVDTSTSTVVEDTGKVASTVTSYTLNANALTNGKNYQWRVTTWDSQGQQGPYSAYSTFSTAAAPSVTITTPASGATDASSGITVQWSYSDPASNAQQSFDVQLLAADDTTVLADSGTVTSSGNQYTIPYTLANNTSYHVRVRATNSKGITSAWADNAFSTSFTPPAAATTTATVNTGYIAINIVNPTPTGSQPVVAYNDVYRRNSGTLSWQRIATQVPVNATYADYAAASGQAYDYKVTAIGNNSTQVDSTVVSTAGVTLTGPGKPGGANPADTVLNLSHNTGQNDDWKPTATPMQFAGRTRPVVEFGEQESYTFNVDLYLANNAANWPALRDLIRSKPTLCVRDSMGTKVFGVILDLPKADTTWGDKTSSLSVTEIDYSETV